MLTSNRVGDTQMTITLTSPDAPVQAELADARGNGARHVLSRQTPRHLGQDPVFERRRLVAMPLAFSSPCGDQPTVPVGAAHRDAARADILQVDLRQGPGLQAIAWRQPVIVTELRFDSRWRFWGTAGRLISASGPCCRSGLTDGDTSGALNLYSRRPCRFDSADLALAQAFAAHASIAVAVAAEREQLLRAVQTRAIVGQAQGRLMERHHITADRALTALRRYASHTGQEAAADRAARHR